MSEHYELDHSKQIIAQPGNKEAISLWRSVILQNIRNDNYNLSSRQMAILLVVCTQAGPHTVKSLANDLNITKPPVCRALDMLSRNKLVLRKVDKKDRRIVYIEPLESGYDYLAHYSENIMSQLGEL